MAARPFTVDDGQKLRFVREAGFLDGGGSGFYTVTHIDGDEQKDKNTLWLFDGNGGGASRLAADLDDVSGTAASPDGATLVFVSEVEEKRQIVLVPVAGGDPRTLTSLPQGVGGGLTWSPDGRSIAFTAGPAETRDKSLPYRVDRVTYRFDGLGYLDDAVQDIYVADVETGAVRQLTSDRCMNSDPSWSPDGRSLAYLVAFDPEREYMTRAAIHVIDVASGESRIVVDGEWGAVACPTWSGDGGRIVFLGCDASAGYLLAQKWDVWTVPTAGGEPECRTAGLVAGVRSLVQNDLPIYGELTAARLRIRDDAAYVNGQIGGDIVVYRVALDGPENVESVQAGEGSSAYFADVDPDGRILYQSTSSLDPPQLMLDSTPVTSLNEDLRDVLRPQLHTLDVTASDGLKSEAWALTPPGEGPWPTVLYVHGGPYGAWGSTYSIDFQLLVSAGFAVVFGNFRGSGGYGFEFASRIVGKWGPAGALDHHAALDEAIRVGIADPDRLGVCGLSHGGFATCWLVGTSDRFKAAVAENQVTNRAASYGVADMPWYVAEEHGGPPWEVPDVYAEQSPITHAPKCRTPVLFVIGEQDMRCYHTESEQYYRVLKAHGVPTEMLRLPDSSHTGTITGPVPARIAQNEALVDWFKRYLAV